MNSFINRLKIGLPYLVFGLCALMLGGKFFFPKKLENDYDLAAYGQIPVQQGGRIKPLDSLARSSLMVISGKQEVVEIVDGTFFGKTDRKVASATGWLLDLWTRPEVAHKYRIFRIDYNSLLSLLGLPERPGSYRYSFKELEEAGAMQKLMPLHQKALEKTKETRETFDHKIIGLVQHIQIYQILSRRGEPGIVPSKEGIEEKWTSVDDAIKHLTSPYRAQLSEMINQRLIKTIQGNEKKLEELIQQHGRTAVMQMIRAWGEDETDKEMSRITHQLLTSPYDEKSPLAELKKEFIDTYPAIDHLVGQVETAYVAEDPEKFNQAIGEYHAKFDSQIPVEVLARTDLEARINAFDPFLQCIVLYIAVALFSCFSWLVWSKPLRQTAFALAVLTLVVHTGALISRMYIGNRPPVTNLYSSAIFIGWGSLALCLALEAVYKLGVATFCGGLIGFATLYIARFLSESGDTLEMLQAVLDTNFWLATHVTTVTMGYMATLVAGLIGIVYIFAALFTNSMRGETGKQVSGMIYGVVCFATLLSFVGTVLGGVWADESWGRFWGWDPKENGAVLIVIWNALILHARWAGLVKTRGMAFLAVFGNMITVWSWFGTNQLGIGLHSYGVDKRLVMTCTILWSFHALILLLALIPSRFWASLARQEKA